MLPDEYTKGDAMKSSLLYTLPLALLLACGEQPKDDTAPEADTDTDTDADTDADADADADSDTDADADPGGVSLAYMAVHLDPAAAVDPISGDINTTRPEAYFDDLVDLVLAAEEHGHALTLMLTAQWAAWITDEGSLIDEEYRGASYTSPLELLRAFEAQGHELAIHHHPLTAPSSWDGFTDEDEWTGDRDGDGTEETYFADGGGPNGVDPWYHGDMEAFMARLSPIPAEGGGALVGGTTEEWPEGFSWSASGGPADYIGRDEPGDLVSRPCAAQHGERWLWQLRMRSFTNTGDQILVMNKELPAALSAFEGDPQRWATGTVTHAKNVDETGIAQYESLFQQLADAGLRMARLQDVMGSFPHTRDDPSGAGEDLLCPPEDGEVEPE
jgi:hypothetical protein